ncbi:MAG: biotin--[acetyl-CoA-carboxylase] ligase [Francisellaceae bacterium]
MNKTLKDILNLLNTKDIISGDELGRHLNITRAAIWKAIRQLNEQYHCQIESIKGKGYKLTHHFCFLNENEILEGIDRSTIVLSLFDTLNSTNDYLNKQKNNDGKYQLCISEHQSAGKGRFDRRWHSPFGQNIYLSLKSTLFSDVSELSGLSLATAAVIADGLKTIYPTLDIGIKWPNDIYLNHKKLSGNLTEIKATSNLQTEIIIGIGINVNTMEDARNTISQPWISLAQALGHQEDRNIIINLLLKRLIQMLEIIEKQGCSTFLSLYRHFDFLKNKKITLHLPNGNTVTGIAIGTNERGLIGLKTDNGIDYFSSGEASIDKSFI